MARTNVPQKADFKESKKVTKEWTIIGIVICALVTIVVGRYFFIRSQPDNRPYLSVKKLDWSIKAGESFSFGILIKNSGNTAARVEFEKIAYIVGNKEYFFNLGNDPSRYNILVIPNSENGITVFFDNPGESIENLIFSEADFKLIIKFNYFSNADKEKKRIFSYEEHRKLFRHPDDPSKFTLDNVIYVNAN